MNSQDIREFQRALVDLQEDLPDEDIHAYLNGLGANTIATLVSKEVLRTLPADVQRILRIREGLQTPALPNVKNTGPMEPLQGGRRMRSRKQSKRRKQRQTKKRRSQKRRNGRK